MPTTMKLIAKNVLGSDTASVTFSDIPGTYTDLCLVASTRTTLSVSIANLWTSFNGAPTGTAYSFRTLAGTGSAAFSSSETSQANFAYSYSSGASATSNTFGSFEMYLPNYAGSTNKSVSFTSASETNASSAYIAATAGLWASTAAVTSIVMSPDSGNFASGSSFFLYGITKA